MQEENAHDADPRRSNRRLNVSRDLRPAGLIQSRGRAFDPLPAQKALPHQRIAMMKVCLGQAVKGGGIAARTEYPRRLPSLPLHLRQPIYSLRVISVSARRGRRPAVEEHDTVR